MKAMDANEPSHGDTNLKRTQPDDDNFSEELSGTAAAAAGVEFARLCGVLKRTPRTGWVLRKVPHPESVADHSWRVAVLCLLLQRDNNQTPQLDTSRAIEMAMVHDLAESIVGDIAPSDNVPKEEKQKLETDAIHKIAATLDHATNHPIIPAADDSSTPSAQMPQNKVERTCDRLLRVFEEYERRESPEAKAVKDLDLLDMLVQADEYELANPGLDLDEFFVGTPPTRFHTTVVRDMAQEVHRQREMRRCQTKTDLPTNQETVKKEETSTILSKHDSDFIQTYASANPSHSPEDIESIVRALRKSETTELENLN
eukprot:CAMPEP_0198298928 /NCGR_PEP_ID=MMETSP1449-20131203/42700_1 /TAXON_ID=420275 /ORGANISM="Attheya septentrionalis, Strain CCMP2084" /LENGTH=313 /DNA_ID=CAMNT_0044000327 /DNA_START=321 /DNA_END=1262 /DNA_ORIENTATION=+